MNWEIFIFGMAGGSVATLTIMLWFSILDNDFMDIDEQDKQH